MMVSALASHSAAQVDLDVVQKNFTALAKALNVLRSASSDDGRSLLLESVKDEALRNALIQVIRKN
jgi:hypothetical protein